MYIYVYISALLKLAVYFAGPAPPPDRPFGRTSRVSRVTVVTTTTTTQQQHTPTQKRRFRAKRAVARTLLHVARGVLTLQQHHSVQMPAGNKWQPFNIGGQPPYNHNQAARFRAFQEFEALQGQGKGKSQGKGYNNNHFQQQDQRSKGKGKGKGGPPTAWLGTIEPLAPRNWPEPTARQRVDAAQTQEATAPQGPTRVCEHCATEHSSQLLRTCRNPKCRRPLPLTSEQEEARRSNLLARDQEAQQLTQRYSQPTNEAAGTTPTHNSSKPPTTLTTQDQAALDVLRRRLKIFEEQQDAFTDKERKDLRQQISDLEAKVANNNSQPRSVHHDLAIIHARIDDLNSNHNVQLEKLNNEQEAIKLQIQELNSRLQDIDKIKADATKDYNADLQHWNDLLNKAKSSVNARQSQGITVPTTSEALKEPSTETAQQLNMIAAQADNIKGALTQSNLPQDVQQMISQAVMAATALAAPSKQPPTGEKGRRRSDGDDDMGLQPPLKKTAPGEDAEGRKDVAKSSGDA